MYASNALKFGWLEDLKVVLFGPSERLIVQDEQVWKEAKYISEMIGILACKAVSDEYDSSKELEKRGVKVEYVGGIISDFIKDGCVPMVW